MAQHDQNIANDTGAAVRGDINNALAALFSNSSGASAPGTTTAQMWWADTTSGLLKQRNAANTGWLVRGTLAETFVLARSSNTILGVADHGRVIIATSTFTQTLTAAATLGDGWYAGYRNDGSGVITIDPNGAETIDGGTTITLQPGEACLIYCNGSVFKTVGRVRINDLTEDATPDSTGDYAITWDTSAGGHKKVKLNKLSEGLQKLAFGSVSAQATLDIPIDGYTAYRHLRLVFSLLPATNAVLLDMRASTDGGSTFLSGANYNYSVASWYDDAGAVARVGANGATAIGLSASDIGNASNEGIRGHIELFDFHDDGNLWKLVDGKCAWQNSGATLRTGHSDFGGAVRTVDDVTDIQLFFGSGNLASGTWELYGWS